MKCGGGIYCKVSSPTIEYNTINGNTTTAEYGGAIQVSTYSNPTITGNVMLNNNALLGGGVNCYKFSEPKLFNNIIAWNNAVNAGGGINCLESAVATIVNCTIVGNEALQGGGGISVFNNADATVVNSILWDNTAPVGGEGLVGADNAVAALTMSHSDVEDGQTRIRVKPGSTLDWGANMIDLDPRFADKAGSDFHLTARSPCLGLGDNSVAGLPAFDYEFDPRVASAIVDMGADEFHPHLYAAGKVIPGNTISLRVVGTPGMSVMLGLGAGVREPPQSTPHGDLYLTLPLLASWPLGDLSQDGLLIIEPSVPSGWSSGSEHPFQVLLGPWGGGSSKLTNLLVLRVE